MKIKIFKRVIRYTFDKFQKDQQKAWQLLDQLDPFYKEPLSPNKLINSDLDSAALKAKGGLSI